jgi:F-type H+-transporting ATPase subunit b
VQKQKVAMASELKTVLDSWVRYEQQLKESEQAELTQAVIAQVLANIREPKTQQEILTGAIAEVEREYLSGLVRRPY